jgi:hypothetical protein
MKKGSRGLTNLGTHYSTRLLQILLCPDTLRNKKGEQSKNIIENASYRAFDFGDVKNLLNQVKLTSPITGEAFLRSRTKIRLQSLQLRHHESPLRVFNFICGPIISS